MSGRITLDLVEDIGSMIIRREVTSGANLPNESDIAIKYGASRTVVREAIKMLTAKGLVGSRPRRGTYVEPDEKWNLLDPDVLRWMLQRQFSVELMLQFQKVRYAIEPVAAMEAAEKATEEQVARIGESIEIMRKAERGEGDWLVADISFHVNILHASNNRFFYQLSSLVDTSLRFSTKLTERAKGVRPGRRGEVLNDHAVIYEAIERRDSMAARSLMEGLIDEAISLTQSYQNQQERAAAALKI